MSNPQYPTLPSGQLPDSAKFEISSKSNVVRKEMEGGYVVTRRRTTRKPRLNFKVGYTAIPGADRDAIHAFWDSMGGQAKIFEWVSRQDGLTYLVRFKDEEITYRYVGKGETQLWDCSFTLEQA